MTSAALHRSDLVRLGRRLEYFTVGYNVLEGFLSIAAGWIAGSISLVGFGLDSLIEVTSGAALLWRLHHDLDAARRPRVEQTTMRIIGACFLALAVYIVYDSGAAIVQRAAPRSSV